MQVFNIIIGFSFIAVLIIDELKTNKIHNKNLVIFFIIGLLINVFYDGVTGIKQTLLGGAIPLSLLPFFALRMLGAANIKAFCTIGSITGFPYIIQIISFTFLTWFIIRLSCVLICRGFVKSYRGSILNIRKCFQEKESLEYNESIVKNNKFRFSFVLMLGFLFVFIINFII